MSFLNSYLELFLQGRPGTPWLAGPSQCLALGIQMPLLSSGTPVAVSQPTGPEPPWLHCGVPSVGIHQLYKRCIKTNFEITVVCFITIGLGLG